MVNSVDQIAEQIFKTIKGFGHSIVLFTDDGKKTVDPTAARRFYAKDIQMMVNFVVDETTNELVVNLSKETDIKAVSPMLAGLRKIASRYIIEYTVKTFGKTIKPRDFAFMAKNKIEESDKPMADKGLISYRYKGDYGYVMIGASDHNDAKNEAKRSIDSNFDSDKLEVWNTKTKKYQKIKEAKMVNEPFDEDNDRYIVHAVSPFWKKEHYVDANSPGAYIMKAHIKHATTMSLKQAERVAAAVEGGANQWRTEIMPHNNINEVRTSTELFKSAYELGKTSKKRGWEKHSPYGTSKASIFWSAGFDGESMPNIARTRMPPKVTNEESDIKLKKRFDRNVASIKRKFKDPELQKKKIADVKKMIYTTSQRRATEDKTEVEEANYDYPTNIKGKGKLDYDRSGIDNRKKRKEFRKKQKAKAHKDLMTRKPESVSEGFSGWHGSSRRSVNELGGAKIIVRHRNKVDEEKRGARTRQIQSIFIENSVGERFKFPSTNITAAKAMLRHVQEGGAPFDDFGQYIYGIMEELDQLKNFQRKDRKANFFEDEKISEEIGNHIGSLRNNLKQMAGLKGYASHFESFSNEKQEISEDELSELKDSVTVSYFDESISESLPYIARIIEVMRTRKDKQAEIIKFAQYVMDNRENIELTTPIDNADPENPAARNFKDPATAFSAWVNYLAPKMKDDILSNMMMAVSDTVFDIESKYLSMAAAGIKVIKQRGRVAESTDVGDEIVPLDEVELSKIVESFDKYNVRKIFGV